jgi:hypothetical protein
MQTNVPNASGCWPQVWPQVWHTHLDGCSRTCLFEHRTHTCQPLQVSLQVAHEVANAAISHKRSGQGARLEQPMRPANGSTVTQAGCHKAGCRKEGLRCPFELGRGSKTSVAGQ